MGKRGQLLWGTEWQTSKIPPWSEQATPRKFDFSLEIPNRVSLQMWCGCLYHKTRIEFRALPPPSRLVMFSVECTLVLKKAWSGWNCYMKMWTPVHTYCSNISIKRHWEICDGRQSGLFQYESVVHKVTKSWFLGGDCFPPLKDVGELAKSGRIICIPNLPSAGWGGQFLNKGDGGQAMKGHSQGVALSRSYQSYDYQSWYTKEQRIS